MWWWLQARKDLNSPNIKWYMLLKTGGRVLYSITLVKSVDLSASRDTKYVNEQGHHSLKFFLLEPLLLTWIDFNPGMDT